MKKLIHRIKLTPGSWYKEKLAFIALILAASVSTNQVSKVVYLLAGSVPISIMLAVVMEISLFLTMSAIAFRYIQSVHKKSENDVNLDVDDKLRKAKLWFGFVNLWGNVFASFYYQINRDTDPINFETVLKWGNYSEISQAVGTILIVISTLIIWGGVTYTIVQTSTILGVFGVQTKAGRKELVRKYGENPDDNSKTSFTVKSTEKGFKVTEIVNNGETIKSEQQESAQEVAKSIEEANTEKPGPEKPYFQNSGGKFKP